MPTLTHGDRPEDTVPERRVGPISDLRRRKALLRDGALGWTEIKDADMNRHPIRIVANRLRQVAMTSCAMSKQVCLSAQGDFPLEPLMFCWHLTLRSLRKNESANCNRKFWYSWAARYTNRVAKTAAN
jgi:hypothetical protein